MTRKANRPEELWAAATYEQMADLREWIKSRVKQRHAESISAWLLSLGTEEPVTPHKRQLAFFRRLLDEYGPPRPMADDAKPAGGIPGPPPASPESPGTESRGTEHPATHTAGRFHRA